jgi:hypothetical protein
MLQHLLDLLENRFCEQVPPGNNAGYGGNTPCGADPEEQLRQWQREGGPNPGPPHDHPPHHQDAWEQTGADPGGSLEVLLAIRITAAFADKNHGRRLKSYKIFSPTI